MGTLASLTVELEAQNKQFQAGVSQIESRLKSFERTALGSLLKTEVGFTHLGEHVSHTVERFSGIGEKAALAFEGLAAIAAGGALGHLVREALESAESVEEMSKRLGIGTTALQEFHGAALVSGVGVEQMDAALTKFSISVATAAENSQSKLGRLFKSLGVEVLDAGHQVLATEGVFTHFLTALAEQVPNASERLKILREAIGKAGGALGALAAEDPAGLTHLMQRLHEVGAVMSPEVVEKGAALNRELTLLDEGIKTKLNSSLINLGPLLLHAKSGVLDLLSAIERWTQSVERFNLGQMNKELAALDAEITSVKQNAEARAHGSVLEQLWAGVRLAGESPEDRLQRLGAQRARLQAEFPLMGPPAPNTVGLHEPRTDLDAGKALAGRRQAAQAEIAVLTQQAALYDQVRAGSLDYKAALTQIAIAEKAVHLESVPLATALVTAKEHFEQSKKAVEDDRKALEQRAEALQHNLDRQLSLVRGIENERASLEAEIAVMRTGMAEHESYGTILHNLAVEHEKLRLEAQGFTGDAGAEAEGLVNLREQADGYRASLDRVHEAGVRTLHDLADGFMNMVETGDFSFKNLERIGLTVWRDITQEIIDNSIDKAMKKSAAGGGGGGGGLFDFIGSLLPSLFGGGGGGGTGVTGAQLMQTPILTAQHGGLVPGSGPVPMVLHGGELVLSATQTDALMAASTRHIPTEGFSSEARGATGAGGRGTTVVVNIQATDLQSFRRSESRIAARLGGAVERANRRNN